MPVQIAADISFRVATDDLVVRFRIPVINDHLQPYSPVADGFEAKQRVVDTSKFAGGDEDNRVILFADIVDRQVIFRKGNHEASGAFQQNAVVAVGKYPGGFFYFPKINRAVIQSGSQMRRGGIRKYFGHGVACPVFFGIIDSHDPAVEGNIFRVTGITGLDQLLRDGASAFAVPQAGDVTGGVTLSGIRVDARNKIDIPFHLRFFYMRRLAMIYMG